MPENRTKHARRAGPRGPLVVDIRSMSPGCARLWAFTLPAPAELGTAMVRVPAGAPLRLEVQLEGVSEGVLVTGTATAPLVGECARCLRPFTAEGETRFRELFARDSETAGPDGYLVDGDVLDLEPVLRDSLVLELPLAPLCADDCPGLCPECGAVLAEAGSEHAHERRGGPWAALEGLRKEMDGPVGNGGSDEHRAGSRKER